MCELKKNLDIDIASEISQSLTCNDNLEKHYIYVRIDGTMKQKMLEIFDHLNIIEDHHCFIRVFIFKNIPADDFKRVIYINPSACSNQDIKFPDIVDINGLEDISIDICIQNTLKIVDCLYKIPVFFEKFIIQLLHSIDCITPQDRHIRFLFKASKPTEGLHLANSLAYVVDKPPEEDISSMLEEGYDSVDTTAEEMNRLSLQP